ncbi:MAG: hypothetical protein ACM30I_07275 [Gemmatimonas sp.]
MTLNVETLKTHHVFALGVLAVGAVIVLAKLVLSAVTGTIVISASVSENCAITTAADSGLAASLNTALTTTGSHSVTVGSVTQSCNKKAGYTLEVTSENCPTTVLGSLAPAVGAKLMNTAAGNEEYQRYSVTFTNPSGTSPTGLLASTCTAALARDVTGTKVASQLSSVSIVFTTAVNEISDEIAGAGTFSDTLTIHMTVK